MNREEIVTEVRNASGNYFKEGYNCSESVFKAATEQLIPDLDPNLIRIMTGFGGGIGGAGCLCGALTGAIAAMNLIVGRTSKEEDRKVAYTHAKAFHDIFVNQFGATCCRSLRGSDRGICLKITGNTGKLLMEYMIENGLCKSE